MKKTLVMFAAGMIPAVMAAATVTLQPISPQWKKTSDHSASIDYKGNRVWPALKLVPGEALKPNTLYRITFEAKSSSPELIFCMFDSVLNGKKQGLYTTFFPTKDFKKYTCYFNSGETPAMGNPRIYFNPSKAFQMKVKDVKLDEMTGELLYGQNLLSWGDFENDNTFRPFAKDMKDRIKIDDSDVKSGKKSLLLDCVQGKKTMITSVLIPAIPGKEIEVKFFAKSADAARIRVNFNWWAPGGKHCDKSFYFTLENEWKEYTLNFQVPEDVEKRPVLRRNLMSSFSIEGQCLTKDGDAKIYIDDISYKIKK